MRFFRLLWLQRILPFLLLVLLSAGPFGFIAPQGEGKDELVIHSPHFLAELCGSLQKIQINYGLDAVHVSRVPFFTKIISENYIPGTSFDPISTDLLTNPNRGPPRLIAIL
jgi:hypothetical protein